MAFETTEIGWEQNSMTTIWKFPIKIEREQVLQAPAGARVLHVGLDPIGVPCIWCLVTTTNDRVPFPVAVCGTGHPIPMDGIHRGSFTQGPFVWHVFTLLIIVQPPSEI